MEIGSNFQKKHLICILGPTAVGKTALAIQLAQQFETEIISADSRQIYKYLDIGTAKPSQNELSLVKHHLINELEPNQDYNAALFEKDSLKISEEIFQERNVLILAGGTFLYVDALQNGLSPIPKINPKIRKQLQAELFEKGIEYLQIELKKNDPETFQKIDISNPQRMLRALEVFRGTGKPIVHFHRTQKQVQRNFQFHKIELQMPREILYNRINLRVEQMMESGLVDEVKQILERGFSRNLNALQTVGYKETIDFLENKHSLERAVELIKRNTRRYAKRQMTWLRNSEIDLRLSMNKSIWKIELEKFLQEGIV